MAAAKNHDLKPKQHEAILALLVEPSIARAAEKIKVNVRTMHRWLDEPVFAAGYHKARRDAFSQAVGQLQRYAPLAANCLAKVMADAAAQPSAKVSAASAVFKFGREGIELDDLAARLKILEDAAADAQKNKDNPQWNRNGSIN